MHALHAVRRTPGLNHIPLLAPDRACSPVIQLHSTDRLAAMQPAATTHAQLEKAAGGAKPRGMSCRYEFLRAPLSSYLQTTASSLLLCLCILLDVTFISPRE